jgi:hypothetical protein
VEKACKLTPQYASQLIKAAEWMSNVGHVQHLGWAANMEHVPHLAKVTDTATLFLLSADTTPEDVRHAAGNRGGASATRLNQGGLQALPHLLNHDWLGAPKGQGVDGRD